MRLFGPRRTGSTKGYSVIDERLTVRGELDTQGTVRVDGCVQGGTHRVAHLVVGPKGSVVGDVESMDVVVAGVIEGNVRASGRIEIEEGATVRGDIRANTMTLREGGAVHGQVSIGSAGSDASGASPAQTAAGRHLEIAGSSTSSRAIG